MTIFSYANGHTKEELKDHIRAALRTTTNITNSRVFKFVENIGLDAPTFNDAIKLTIIFHDFGKIFYQDCWSKKGHLYFTGHENISAKFLNEFFRNFDSKTCLIKFKNSMIFAVLYHHHAMGNRQISVNVVNHNRTSILLEEFERDILQIMKEHKLEYEDALKDAISRFEGLLKTRQGLSLIFGKNELRNTVWKAYVRGGNERSLMLLSLAILVASDYNASKRRGGCPSAFHMAAEEFVNSYLRCFI